MAYMDDAFYVVRDSAGLVIQNHDAGTAGGMWVRLPLDVFDALVLMRMAQLWESPEHEIYIAALGAKVCEDYPNLGTEALRRRLGLPPLTEDD